MSETSSKRVCPKCSADVPVGKQYCPGCLFNYGYWENTGREYREESISKRLDSTYDKRFMFNDRQWDKDIKARRITKDGRIGRFDPRGTRIG